MIGRKRKYVHETQDLQNGMWVICKSDVIVIMLCY
jgi:hypothetical protein